MNLSDYKGEDALELLADIIDPAVEIISDEKVRDAITSGATKMSIIKKILKEHKKSVLAIMATIDGVSVEDYKPNVFTLPLKLIALLNDKDFMQLFFSQEQRTEQTSSGFATENTEVLDA